MAENPRKCQSKSLAKFMHRDSHYGPEVGSTNAPVLRWLAKPPCFLTPNSGQPSKLLVICETGPGSLMEASVRVRGELHDKLSCRRNIYVKSVFTYTIETFCSSPVWPKCWEGTPGSKQEEVWRGWWHSITAYRLSQEGRWLAIRTN